VLEREESMLVQRVDHLAVQTLVYTQHQYLPAYLHRLVAAEIFHFYFFIANLTHVTISQRSLQPRTIACLHAPAP